MKKVLVLVASCAALALPSSAMAFHHTSIPAGVCANANAGSPSNDNGQSKENLKGQDRGGEAAGGLPLPPVGTPGAGKGQGDEHCAANGN